MAEKKIKEVKEEEKALSFEEALGRIEEILSLLEGGKAPLDEALKAYEEGVSLVRLCGGYLADAEAKITKINCAE